MVLAIDPGCALSAYVLVNPDTYDLVQFGKVENMELREIIETLIKRVDESAIEMISSYGKPVGREVFDTCLWIGRYQELIESFGVPVQRILRRDVKLHLCGQTKSKDTDVRRALINRFAKFDLKNGKGKKDNPDHFYGVANDVWAATAVAVYYIDKKKEGRLP